MASTMAFSVRRSFMAQERTLMAWIRTSVSLISFGFSIYKFFGCLPKTEQAPVLRSAFGPRRLAISMLSIGVLHL